MKKSNLLLAAIFLSITVLFPSLSCKKQDDNNPNPDNSNGTKSLTVKKIDNSVLELPVDSGDIGLIIDTRSIAKKGYKPSYISININGSLSLYSNDHLSVNSSTNLAILKIKRNSLSKDEINEAVVGPKVTISVYDAANNKLAEVTKSSLPINDQNKYFEVKTKKASIRYDFKLNPNVPYIIQESATTNPDGNISEVITFSGGGGNPVNRDTYDKENTSGQEFYFIQANPKDKEDDSTYYIRTSFKGNNSKYYYLDIFRGYNEEYQLNAYNDLPNSDEDYKFIIRRDDSGWVSIKPIKYPPLKDISSQFTPYSNNPVAKFRIISAAIKWEVTDLGTEYNQPILPSQHLDLAVSSQLINCSSANLSQSIGKEDTRIMTTTFGTSEQFQLTTSQNTSVSINSTIGASASFYGAGVSASVSVGSEFSFGRSVTSTKTHTFENSTQKEFDVSTSRTVEVPSYTGITVYDAVETYSNVKIPFVQKLRVGGSFNNKELSGDEIVTQLMQNQFGGVITEIGSTYVIITVRGAALIDNFMNTQSKVDDIDGACSVK